MRASEALLLNSHRFPQVRGFLVTPQGGRCAIGTIVDDMDYETARFNPNKVYLTVAQRYHIMTKASSYNPERTVMTVIIYLNDGRKWTRPRIAEWLRKVEDKYGEIGPQLPTKGGEYVVCDDHITVGSERL